MTRLDYIILAIYVIVVVGLGTVFSKKQKSLKEFFLGSRNIPWWAAAFSGIATTISAIGYLGAPGQAFKSNLTYLQYRLALPVAIFVNVFVFLPFFYRLEIYSIYEYLEKRFDLKTRLLASALFIILKSTYLGIGIYASALLLVQMTHLPQTVLILTIGLITAIYTMLGGIRGVIWTDTAQLIILLSGIAVAMYMIVSRFDGGVATVYSLALAEHKLRFFDFSFSLSREVTFWGGLIGGAFVMISEFGTDQALMQRFLTARSIRKSQLAMVSSMVVAALVGASLFLLGSGLYVFYTKFPGAEGVAMNPDLVFPRFIVEVLPRGIRGLLVAAVFSAAMSTISAVLNSLSTVTLVDFYQRLSGRAATIRLARITTLVAGAACTVIALEAARLGNILVASTKVSGFFGGCMAGVFLLGVLVRRANGAGAFVGALIGLLGMTLVSVLTPLSWMWYGVFSAVLTFGSGLLVSMVFKDSAATTSEALLFMRGAE